MTVRFGSFPAGRYNARILQHCLKSEQGMSSIQRVHRGEKLGIINEILEEQGCIVIENVLDDIRHGLLQAEIWPLPRRARGISTASRPSA
jgi:hypothetical protein